MVIWRDLETIVITYVFNKLYSIMELLWTKSYFNSKADFSGMSPKYSKELKKSFLGRPFLKKFASLILMFKKTLNKFLLSKIAGNIRIEF